MMETSYHPKICPLCMQPVNSEFRPEEMNIIKDSDICKCCFNPARIDNSFLKDCLEVEKRTVNIPNNSAIDIKGNISALDLLKATDNLHKEMETFEIEMTIKEECVDIKLEDEEESDTSLSNLNVGAVKDDTRKKAENDTHEVKCTSTDAIESENFKCYMETIRQNNSEVHQSTMQHKTVLHVKIHTCDACEYKTMCKSHFSVHCVEHKDGLDVNTYYKCAYENINQKFIPKYSSAHRLKTNKGSRAQIFKRNMCEYTDYSTTIAVHQQLKHKDSSKVYKCDICSYTIQNIKTLECHLSEHNASSKAPVYKCDLCYFETNTRTGFNYHHLKHKHMYKCNIYSFTTRGKTLLAHHRLQLVPSYAQGYICNNCSYHTQRKTYFRYHVLKHICPKILMYKCSNCICETKNVNLFARHLLECSVPSEAQMDKCDETIYQRKLLFDKLKHNDTLGNIHECNTCGYESKEIDKFLNHLLTRRLFGDVLVQV